MKALTVEETVARYPRFVRLLMNAYVLAPFEAAVTISAHKAGRAGCCEAINWCGRTATDAVRFAWQTHGSLLQRVGN